MSFYERFEALCTETGLKPQSKEMQEITGCSSPAISGWKNGSLPKVDALCRISQHFHVSTDYLLCLTELRSPTAFPSLSEQERLLLDTFRAAGAEGQFSIIQTAMNVREMEKGKNVG